MSDKCWCKKNYRYRKNWKHIQLLKELEIESHNRFKLKEIELFIWHKILSDHTLLNHIEIENDWSNAKKDLILCGTLPLMTAHHYLPTIFRHVAARLGIFGWGRVEMFLMLSEKIAHLLTMPEGQKGRSVMTLQGQAYCKFEYLMTIPKEQLDPSPKENMILTRITPLAKPQSEGIPFEEYEYVIRQLNVQKGNPLEQAIASLGPGAIQLLDMLSLSPRIVPRNMTISDFVAVARAYNAWPHKQTIDDVEKLTMRDL